MEGSVVEMNGVGSPTAGGSDEYFTSYDDLEIHRLMLEDTPRTTAYQRAIENVDLKGKVVMDVGAGSGILSLFCMRAGAARVYAVEACPGMARPLREVVEANKGSDVIKVVAGRVEDIPSLPEPVDVLVSEWMGFYLLHESMLDSVLHARDRFLRKDGAGVMLPSHATIYTAPCSLDTHLQSKVTFWNNVYGFDMSALGREAVRRGRGLGAKPEVMVLGPDQILAEPQTFAKLDLRTCTSTDLDALSNRHFVSIKRTGNNHGIAIWFDCLFEPSGVVLCTGPQSAPTHWKQTVIVTASAESEASRTSSEGVVAEVSPHLVEEDDIIGWELVLNRAEEETPSMPEATGAGKKRSREAGNASSSAGGGSATGGRCRNYAIQVRALDPVDDTHPTPCNCQMAKCVLMQALEKEFDEDEDLEGEVMDLT